MQRCDVCNETVSDGEGERLTPDAFSFFLDNGLGIHESNIGMLTDAGISRQAAIEALKQQYRQSSSDWLLCTKCAVEAVSELARQKYQWVSPDCISITGAAEEAGMGFAIIGAPVALNRDVWNQLVVWTDQDTQQQCYQEQEARLWDVVFTGAATLGLESDKFIKEAEHCYSICAVPRDGSSSEAISIPLSIRHAEIRGQMWLVIEKANGPSTIKQVGKRAINFDEETWAEAKPMFIEAVQEFRLTAKDVGLLAVFLTRKLQDVYGLSVDAIEEMRPYLARFIREVRKGTIEVVAPERKQAQQLPDRSGMRLRSEQLERLVQGHYQASQDKNVPAETRLRFRMEAMRGRALSKWSRELKNTKAAPRRGPSKKDP